LYSFHLSKPLLLFVDASPYSVLGALTQIGDNGKHLPVTFVSTKLTETQRKWSVIEREAFSLIVFLRKYRQWILGTVAYVYSDHNPLSFLTESGPKSAKLMRWALALQEFSFLFQYSRLLVETTRLTSMNGQYHIVQLMFVYICKN